MKETTVEQPDCHWIGTHIEDPKRRGFCRLCGKQAEKPQKTQSAKQEDE
jgi:hypothetical protein